MAVKVQKKKRNEVKKKKKDESTVVQLFSGQKLIQKTVCFMDSVIFVCYG